MQSGMLPFHEQPNGIITGPFQWFIQILKDENFILMTHELRVTIYDQDYKKKTIPLYILAQAQTCVPIPIPELNPCAQRILQTESSLFSSFNLLSTLSGFHGPFSPSQGPIRLKIG